MLILTTKVRACVSLKKSIEAVPNQGHGLTLPENILRGNYIGPTVYIIYSSYSGTRQDWLQAPPISPCDMRLDDETTRVVVGLRLGV